MDVEHVFKALADHHRRHLLDLLAQDDGQTLGQLCAELPMSRIGVMKHLRILQDARLIITHKVGRERLHYLNPTPIHAVGDWAEQYRRFRVAGFVRLDAYLRQVQAQEFVAAEPAPDEFTALKSAEETEKEK